MSSFLSYKHLALVGMADTTRHGTTGGQRSMDIDSGPISRNDTVFEANLPGGLVDAFSSQLASQQFGVSTSPYVALASVTPA